MTPEQLREAYRATHQRILQIAQEEEALEAIDRALDAYANLVGYDLAAIVDPVIEQPASMAAGSDGAGTGERPVGPAPVAAEGTIPCPQCGKELKRQGYGPHMAKKHGVAGAGKAKPRGASPPLIGKAAQAVQPTTTNGRESYLCPRCSEPFPSRDALLNHMQKGHKPAPPASTRPFGPQLSVERTGGGLSMNEQVFG